MNLSLLFNPNYTYPPKNLWSSLKYPQIWTNYPLSTSVKKSTIPPSFQMWTSKYSTFNQTPPLNFTLKNCLRKQYKRLNNFKNVFLCDYCH